MPVQNEREAFTKQLQDAFKKKAEESAKLKQTIES